MTEIELFDYLVNNRIELRRQIKPHISSIIKNKDMFLPFEFKDRVKDEIDQLLVSMLIDTYKTNIEEAKILLESDKISTTLECLFYDDKEYS